MKASVKVTSITLYLLCLAALFMPYHIDALSGTPISGMNLMFGYSIHENPIKGEYLFILVLLAPLLLGLGFNIFGKVGKSASIVSIFVGFGMALFHFFMFVKENVWGVTLSMIFYAMVAFVGVVGYFGYFRSYLADVEEEPEEPVKEINPLDAPPKKFEPLKTPEPFVKKELVKPASVIRAPEPVVNPEPVKEAVAAVKQPEQPKTVNVSSVDRFYNDIKPKTGEKNDEPEVKLYDPKEETNYEEFYHKPMDFDYFLEKYKQEHNDD